MPRLYLLAALPVAVAMALLFPIGEGPDEATHAARAASVLHGQWIGRRVQLQHFVDGMPVTVAGVDINPGYLAPFLALPSLPEAARKPVTLDAVQAAAARRWPTGTVFVEASNTAGYMPLLYLPAAAGMGLAALVRAGPMEAVLAARLANAAACVLTGYAALRLARRGRPALFALLALPMTLHLSAAVSQDGPLIAAAALAAALLPRGGRLYWAGAAALACVAAAKPPYLPLALLALVPLDGRPFRLRRQGGGFLLVVLAGTAWAAAAAALAVAPFWRAPYHPGPLWTGDPGALFRSTDPAAQLGILLHRPALLLRLPLETLAQGWRYLASSAVGVFASLDFTLPAWLYRLWYAALAAAALGAMALPRGDPSPAPRPWVTALLLAGGAACLWGIILLQYLSWTNVGQAAVDGLQGRYLLPILLLLVPALPGLRLPALGAGTARALLTLPAAAAALLGLGVLPAAVVLRYYLR